MSLQSRNFPSAAAYPPLISRLCCEASQSVRSVQDVHLLGSETLVYSYFHKLDPSCSHESSPQGNIVLYSWC